MRKGFIFNYEFCVGCKACSAACMLENGWNFRARNIYSSNKGCYTPDPVINLSMACNHCDDPPCLIGCPSVAYSKDHNTGAILIDPQKCLGCGYCTWNCPFDSPRLNEEKGIIEKCHFCFNRLEDGYEPSCTSSCPTGALTYGEIPETIRYSNYLWMPQKEMRPSMQIKGSDEYYGPVIVPEKQVDVIPIMEKPDSSESRKWSLVGFTFLTTLSVAINTSAIFTEKIINGSFTIALVVVAGILSLFHLRSVSKAWRAVSNLISSPLSREIALFIIYAFLVILNQIIEIPCCGIIAAVAGIFLVLMIDSVYSFSTGKGAFSLHSGQALLTVMLMISFLLNAAIPFIFLALIKMVLTIRQMSVRIQIDSFVFRFLRLALLFITAMVVVSGMDSDSSGILLAFLTGELFDRKSFYDDFRPMNIKNSLI